MKKVLALALTLVMVLGMFTVISFADDNAVKFSGTYNAAAAGQTVTLTVKLDSTTVPLGGLTMEIRFDKDALEVTSTEKEIKGTIGITHGTASAATLLEGEVDINTIDTDEFQSDACTICVINFKALKDVGDGAFTVTPVSVLDEHATNLVGSADVTAPVTAIKADVTALAAAIDAAGKVDTTKYTEDSVKALNDAVTAGQALLTVVEAGRQDEINAAADAITAAINALVAYKTMDELKELVTASKDLKGSYTADSLKAFNDALAAAEALKDDATPAEISAAYAALDSAKAALVALKTADELKALVDECGKLVAADYTTASFADMTKALNDAQALLKEEDPDAAKIDAAYTALEAAKNALVKATKDEPAKEDDKNPDTSDTNVAIFAGLSVLALVAAGFVVAKKRKYN